MILVSLVIIPAAAEQLDYFGVFNLGIDVFKMFMLGESGGMGAGATIDFNTGPLLWHGSAHVLLEMSDFTPGVEADLGVGFIVSGTYETAADYTQIIEISSWTVGDYRYSVSQRIDGKCWAAFFHVIEAGVKPHYVALEGDEFTDVIMYAGYRFASFYAAWLPMQEFEIALHGLLGTNGDEFYPGGELRLVWQAFNVGVGVYGEMFYFQLTIRTALTFM